MAEGSWVGLDVHVRTTQAGVLDGVSGVLDLQRVSPRSASRSRASSPVTAGRWRR
jgi:hypothetical protein